jgi:transglutaminase-like putative cysteine protease
VILKVRHRTTYAYAHPVSVSHHLVHLTPRTGGHQLCHEHALEVAPAPTVQADESDYFGNGTTFLTVQTAHTELVLEATSRVEVRARRPHEIAATPAWERLAERLRRPRSLEALTAAELALPSPRAPLVDELTAWARPSFPPARPVLEGALDLVGRIHREFRYDPSATDAGTSVAEAFTLKAGVCQDFAHLAIAALRGLGLPARYVSGYLLTRPPPGRERLIGADASHAWLAVWTGEQGWIDLDPTNDVVPGEEHVTLAWGRDYADVAPVTGVMFGGGEHRVHVAVDVAPAS